jgi:type I restriction enzyme S subunit
MAGEWQETTVAELAVKERGTVSGPFGSSISKRFFVDHGIPVIRGNNLSLGTDGPRFHDDDFVFLMSEKADELASAECKVGDLVFTARGTLGQVGLIPPTARYSRYILSANQLRFRPDSAKADARFLYYWFSSPKMVALMQSRNAGSALPNMNLGALRGLPVVLPPLPDQRAIAHILGTLDDKIELNRRTNETLEAMARALFKSWFVNFDPVRAKAEGRDPGLPKHLADLFPDSFEDSELGEIPRGWRAGKLGDVGSHPRRGVQPDDIGPDVPYIALEHMPKRSVALSEWDLAQEVESNKFAFKKGEVLFGKLRPYFHKVGIAPVDGVCSTDIVVVAPKEPQWFSFVLGLVSSDEFVAYTNAGSTGTKMPRTSWGEMARYDIALPPAGVSRALTERMRSSVDRIILGIHEARTLAALRDALLPKLISGELRINDAEKFIARAGI